MIINIPVFILAFLIGLYVVSIQNKTKVYPTKNNQHLIQYKNTIGECYTFKIMPQKCPSTYTSVPSSV